MANGQFENVSAPFNTRLLAPLIAGQLQTILQIATPDALVTLNIAALLMLAIALSLYLTKQGCHPLSVIPLLCVPYLFTLYQFIYVPDLFAVSVCGIALIGLLYGGLRGMGIAVIFTILAILTRPSLAVLFGVAVLLLAIDKRWWSATMIIGATIIGYLAVSKLTANFDTNAHQLNSSLYMVLKIPVNIARNYLGLNIATDATAHYCPTPMFLFDTSRWPLMGNIQSVRICYPNWIHALNTIGNLALIIGIWPWLALRRVPFRTLVKNWRPHAYLFPILLFLLMGPMLGLTVQRLFLYAFVVYLIALPHLITTIGVQNSPIRYCIIAGATNIVGIAHLIWLSPDS
ncbi:MAG: hypothetical protein ABF335_06640 [Alphaproteobacteria bacterium]